jgi:hypothetical protein
LNTYRDLLFLGIGHGIEWCDELSADSSGYVIDLVRDEAVVIHE